MPLLNHFRMPKNPKRSIRMFKLLNKIFNKLMVMFIKRSKNNYKLNKMLLELTIKQRKMLNLLKMKKNKNNSLN